MLPAVRGTRQGGSRVTRVTSLGSLPSSRGVTRAVGDNGGKTGKQIAAETAAATDAQPITVRCAFCRRWSWTGPAGEARAKARIHRERRHPDLVPIRRPRTNLNRWTRPTWDDEDRADAMVEVARRKATTHADEAA